MSKCSHELSWADKKFGCFRCGKRRCRPGIRIGYTLRGRDGTGADYREDLARSPMEYRLDPRWKPGMGDPEAYVDGPRAVSKLWEKRQRQGWTEAPDKWHDAYTGYGEDVEEPGGEELIRQCYREAQAEGFVVDDTPDPDWEAQFNED